MDILSTPFHKHLTIGRWGKSVIHILLIMLISFSCNPASENKVENNDEVRSSTVVKKRDDGTLSSVNQVDEMGRVHGVRVTYFADGKTIYTKLTFNHGKKHGPTIRYYNNGQIYEHSNFENGERHGLTRKYYKTGKPMAEFEYSQGIALSGLKEYDKVGELINSYPTVEFKEVNHLASNDRIGLEIRCSKPYNGTKYFLIKGENERANRTFLITEKGFALVQFYLKPGETLSKKVEIMSEIPTELGNVYVKRYTHHLTARNDK